MSSSKILNAFLVAITLIFTSLSPAFAHGPFDSVPNEVIKEMVLNNFDIFSVQPLLRTHHRFNLLLNTKDLETLKKNCTRIERLDELPTFSKKKITYILNQKDQVITDLLAKITQNDLALVKTLIGKEELSEAEKNKVFLAAFLAENVVNFSLVKGAEWNSEWVAAWDVIWDAAQSLGRDAVCETARDAAWGAAWYTVRQAVKVVVSQPIQAVFAQLALTDPKEMDQKGHAIAELLALNWVRKENAKYFTDAFTAAYALLDGSISIEAASVIIDREIGKPELANNPFIAELKNFLAGVKELLGVPQSSPVQ